MYLAGLLYALSEIMNGKYLAQGLAPTKVVGKC